MTLLPLVRMFPVSVPLNVPAPDAPLLNVTVVVLVGFAGLLLASCDCTVTLKANPSVPVDGTVVYPNLLTAPAENTMFPLVTGVRPVIPAVGVAVSVIVSDFE